MAFSVNIYEVRELKKEWHISKSEVKGLREESGKLKEHIEHDRSGEESGPKGGGEEHDKK